MLCAFVIFIRFYLLVFVFYLIIFSFIFISVLVISVHDEFAFKNVFQFSI